MFVAAPLPSDESARVAALDDYRVLDTQPEEAFDRITALACELFAAPMGAVSLVDRDRQWFKSKRGFSADETPREIAFSAYAILSDDVLVVPDATADARFRNSPFVVGPPRIRTYAGAPLITPAGFRLGTLCVMYTEVTEFSEISRRQLQTLAAVVVDQLELRSALREAKRARVEADRTSNAKSRFLAMISHEIRTPMNGVLGMAEMLHRSPLSAEQRDAVETIRRCGNVLLELLNDILDLSKIEAGRVELDLVDLSLSKLVRTVSALWASRAEEKGIAFSYRLDLAGDRLILCDKTRLRQIINNLIGNAIKFTSEGGIELVVAETPRDDGKIALRFQVRDTGIGISPDRVGRLFKPFSQADGAIARKYGGTGLGLAICRELVTLLGGEIGVESIPGEGSTFWFTVTAEPGDEARWHRRDTANATLPGPAPVGERPLRILVAEDDTVNQKVISCLLSPTGWQVDIAENGLEAVAAVARSPYDVVLMDVSMPDVDGLQATQKIRSLGGDAGRLPIIALTANAAPGDRERFLEAGMTDYVSKPVDPRLFFGAIARATGVPAPGRDTPSAQAPFGAEHLGEPLTEETARELEVFIQDLDRMAGRGGR